MKTPTLKKNSRSKSPASAGRYPQGFVPELEIPASTTASVPVEKILPGQRGAALFQMKAPEAVTVKLVANFTGWEKRALDLVRIKDGVWQLTVALPPGRYAYRFLVDGEWCDVPRCGQREPNPYGTMNAVVEVV